MNTATEDLQTPNALVPITPPAPPPPDRVPRMDRVLGVVDLLSEAEQAQLMGCEAVVEMGWRTFVLELLALNPSGGRRCGSCGLWRRFSRQLPYFQVAEPNSGSVVLQENAPRRH